MQRDPQETLLKDMQDRGERLTLEDCFNPLFNVSRPVRRWVKSRGGAEPAFEWVTYTDGYVQIGLTYFLSDGVLTIVAASPRNAPLFTGRVRTPDELEGAIKKADRAYKKLKGKK